ncbi:uncharacterized protein TrAFT101_008826 [Trichoderma asperellum]|uniref:Chromo domain-containing protein n=1 Tax=Trichoderma asperellum (strain ATCC 204424 / CBS 433.97 / NBRC 101777) TaxID=1042311 RepID=A0A2T3ZB90_TRIA4|nr:hypothetical protein M441DRAFT_164895 [Trichoderma asperellum CBS 433.97]PTB42075.1 hypothetical protein M441DRAFT_164895 [Trichoderma asperellum CBS 433.97]UKZ93924.1 hypothetical protein TrAFT101_008826 [Trichoderma asperellum]
MPRSRRGAAKKSKNRKPPADQDLGWYTIRRILDEKTVRGRVQYFVEWDDNAVTGQVYDPTWSSEVTALALQEWERVKAQRLQKDRQEQQLIDQQLEQQLQPEPGSDSEPESGLKERQGQQLPVQLPNHQGQKVQQESTLDQESDASQPPRPAHRRRPVKVNASQQKRQRSPSVASSSSDSSSTRPHKVIRSDTCGSLCDEPGPSLVSSPSISTPSEFPDLPDADISGYRTRATSALVVEIPKNSNINRADYLSVLGSQSSSKSSQSLAELESEDSRVSIVPNNQRTVPGSQEGTNPSWTQIHIPRELLQLSPRLIESQPRDCSPESSSRVIPDSLEDPSTTTSQLSGKATERKASENFIQTLHDTVGSDIPSHQPDRPGDIPEANSPALSPSLSHGTPAACASQAVISSGSSVLVFTQSDASPRFLTQPPISLALEHLENSLTSRIFESPAHPVAEIVSTISSSTPSASDPRASQAAQIVSRNFEIPSQPLTEGESLRSLPQSQITPHQPINAGDQSLVSTSACQSKTAKSPPPLLVPEISRLAAVAIPQIKPLTPLNSFKVRKMENETPEQASERIQRRLDAELSAIFRLDEFDVGATTASYNVDQPESHQTQPNQPSTGALEEHVTPVKEGTRNTHAELPVHSSELPLGVGPLPIKEKAPSENVEAAAEGTAHDKDSTPVIASRSRPPIPRRSVAEELADIFSPVFGGSGSGQPQSIAESVQAEPIEAEQTTVSLADISRQPEPAYKDIPLLSFTHPSEPLMQEPSSDPIHSEQVHSEHSPTESSASPPAAQPSPATLQHYTVTLPFQASLRQRYNNIIVEYRVPFLEFNRCFSGEDYSEPDPSLVNRINELFNNLLNVCDYPENIVGSDLEMLPPGQQAKYCCDANPKFNFIFELLGGIEDHSNILIVARSPELLRLLSHLAESLKMQFSCEAIGRSDLSSGGSSSRLVLALPTEDIDTRDFDVVIGYDHSFRHSSVAQGLSRSPSTNRRQLVLVLVTTHSIEHLDLHIPDDLPPIERKSVLVSAIVRAWNLVESPNHGYQEPHEIASLFIEFLASDQDTPMWDPIPVPEAILDVYVHSQSQSQMPPTVSQQERETGRKRKHNDFDDFDNKRPRVLSIGQMVSSIGTGMPPLSDEVKALLESATPKEDTSRPEVLVNVPQAVLQILAEKFAEYERRIETIDHEAEYQAVISGLEKRLKDYERTAHKMYESQRAALQDRSRFEAEKRKIETAMQSAANQSEREAEKAKKRILELEATVARLTEDPNTSDPKDTPLAKSESLLHEAQAKVAVLEKRLENAHKDADYIRSLYQDAADTASGLKSENNQLRSQNEDLGKKASENFAQIHEIQERNTTKLYLEQITELKFQIKEREIELDRAREELRQLKNGRRETRQSSVPRSPRMGMMSPRTISRAYGGPASRGASPAAGAGIEGMQFYGQQPGNGRWDHLRG